MPKGKDESKGKTQSSQGFWDLIERLKDPYTVANFQRYFGVYPITNKVDDDYDDKMNNCYNYANTKTSVGKNGFTHSLSPPLSSSAPIVPNGNASATILRHRRECSCSSI